MSGAEVEPEAVRVERRRIRGTGESHTITIIVCADGSVQGDLDDTIALNPIGTESTAESTTIDGQAYSILDQAIQRILLDDFAPKAEPVRVPEPTIGESLGLLANTMTEKLGRN